MQKTVHQVYSFDEFALDITRGCLMRGATELKLRPKSYEVLRYLAENGGRLIDKDELIRAVWQDTAVTDDSLVQCLKDIRHALKDDSQQIIRTIPRRGYIFEKEVTENGTAAYTEDTSGVHIVIEESEDVPQRTSGISSLVGTIRRHRLITTAALAAVLVGGAGLAYGMYLFLGNVSSPFRSVNIKTITTDGKAGTAAVSPDGKNVAYTLDEGSLHSLWVRQTAAVNPAQIIAPADADFDGITFSPDGDFIYCTQNEVLYQVPAHGGVVRKVLDHVGKHITFSPDGKQIAYVVHGGGEGSRLIVAKADGTGEERVLAIRKPPYAFTLHGCAWSPDGKTIVCGGGDNPAFGQMFPIAVNVADGTQTALDARIWNAVGQIAWLADGSGFVMTAFGSLDLNSQLWHVSFPAGVSTRVYSDLEMYSDVSLAADSKALVTLQGHPQNHIKSVSFSAEPGRITQLTFGTVGSEGWAAVTTTPDDQIIYSSEAGGTIDLWIMDAAGQNQRQFTFDEAMESSPAVSPDGRSVAFGIASKGIWKVDIAGGNRKQLTTRGMFPNYSADGQWIYYTLPRERFSMWKVSAEGGDPIRVTEHVAALPRVSPDGKMIAYMNLKKIGDPAGKLYVEQLESGEPAKIFDVVSLKGMFDLNWTPDGKEICYNAVQNGFEHIVCQPIDGGQPRAVFTGQTENERVGAFAWSRDGKQLFFSSGTPTWNVVMFDLVR